VSAPLVGVLSLQGDVREHERALVSVGARTCRIRTEDELSRVDGLVIPGGESTTMSMLAVRTGLMQPLDVTVRRNAFGRQVDSFECDLDMPAVPGGPMHAVFIRAPWVEDCGPGVEVLARVEDGPASGRIVAVRQGRALGTAFHPELTGDGRVHALFVEMVRQG
jgi:5'-phosphate synthase pdxT subunit